LKQRCKCTIISLKNRTTQNIFFFLLKILRAAENSEMLLANEQTRQLMNFIAETRRYDKRIDLYFSCESYVGDYEKTLRDSYFFCRAGVNIGSLQRFQTLQRRRHAPLERKTGRYYVLCGGETEIKNFTISCLFSKSRNFGRIPFRLPY